jgi:hypothetical membrane protein
MAKPMGNESKARSYGGVAVLSAMLTGFAALFLASKSGSAGHFEAAGIALLAAAVAFVGVSHAIFRR